MSIDNNKKITIAQAANIAKDIAIAQRGNNVTVDDIATLVKEVYDKVFKKAANDVAKGLIREEKNRNAPKSVEDLISIMQKMPASGLINFRNEHRDSVAKLSKEDKRKLEEAIKINSSTINKEG